MFDSVGAVSFFHLNDKLMLASGSGQRHFKEDYSSDSDSDSDKAKEEIQVDPYSDYRNALRLWQVVTL
jgi:hypothetical protein